MQKQLSALERIQRIDVELGALEAEKLDSSARIAEARKAAAAADDSASAFKDEAAAIKESIARAAEAISRSGERISADEKKLSSIKNDRELKALTKEIDSARKAGKLAEMEKEAAEGRLRDKEAAIAATEAEAAARRAEAEGLASGHAANEAGWEEAARKALEEREALKASIKPAILKTYETIRARRAGLGLVPVKDETCQGCFIHIPPQTYIQLQRGTDELMTCPHCHRILYAESKGSSGDV